MARVDGYILCGVPRSGSTLLCNLLAATGVAGAPDSYVMDGMDPGWRAELGLPDPAGAGTGSYARAYLDAVKLAGTGGTGMFGLRLMQRNLGDLVGLLELVHPGLGSDRARMETEFGQLAFLRLRRGDTLAQAVSWVRAQQSGLWHVAPDGTELERLSAPEPPSYDFERLKAEVARFDTYATGWDAWFASEGIAPVEVTYEALAADPAGELARICGALGVPAPDPASVRPGVAKLSDEVSAEWIRRYRADAGDA